MLRALPRFAADAFPPHVLDDAFDDAALDKTMLATQAGLSRFIRHAGVQTPHDFTLWLTGKAKEYSRMQAAHQTGVHILDPEIEDFVLGKAAAFGEVLENARHVFSLPAPIDTQDTNINP